MLSIVPLSSNQADCYNRPQRSCGKIMFLHVCVVLSTWGWGDGRQTPPVDTPPQDSHCSRWHTSYWNAFLLRLFLPSRGAGISAWEGRCPEGCLPRGVPVQWVSRGVYTSPLWTEFLTHACKNITFPQLLLRTVKMGSMNSYGAIHKTLKYVKNTKGAADKNGAKNGTCKLTFLALMKHKMPLPQKELSTTIFQPALVLLTGSRNSQKMIIPNLKFCIIKVFNHPTIAVIQNDQCGFSRSRIIVYSNCTQNIATIITFNHTKHL